MYDNLVLSSVNSKYLQLDFKSQNLQYSAPVAKQETKKSNKKLLLTLARLAVAGSAIALGILHNKKVDVKSIQNTAQNLSNAIDKGCFEKPVQAALQGFCHPIDKSSGVIHTDSLPKTPEELLTATSKVEKKLDSLLRPANASVKKTINPEVGFEKDEIAKFIAADGVEEISREELAIQKKMKIVGKYAPKKIE